MRAIACVHDDIMRMPMSYDSLIGDMGSSLSGGQRQRILLARALYRQPKLLFMDEGTSNLDTMIETRVNRHPPPRSDTHHHRSSARDDCFRSTLRCDDRRTAARGHAF